MKTDHLATGHRMQAERGFSLIDVAVIMAIVGILLAGFLATYKMYQATRASTVTEENFMAAQEALGAFIPFKGNRYPRPAAFGLQDGDANYGVEVATGDIANCTTVASAVGRVCRVAGSGGNVLIGVLPFASINLSSTQALDGHGRLFTYAVSEPLTVANGADAIDANADGIPDRDADGDMMFRHHVCVQVQELLDDGSITPTPLDCTKANSNPPRPIALVSHGNDGLGGWMPSGQQYRPCASTPAASQDDNCDFDGTFVQSVRRIVENAGQPDEWILRVPMKVEGANNRKNDDLIQVEVREDGNFWSRGTDKIANNYNYKVGIGVSNPVNALDVNGEIKVEAGVLAEDLCADGDCLLTDTLAGSRPEMDCGDLAFVSGIKNNQAECMKIVQPNTNCESDEYVWGFDATGAPICVEMDATCGPAHDKPVGSPPPAVQRCRSGTEGGFSGAGPWSWTCTKGSKVVQCRTVP